MRLATTDIQPPIVINDSVVVAARARGISLAAIARGVGVSPQRIDQRLRRYEKSHDAIAKTYRRSSPAKILLHCPTCGKSKWTTRLAKSRYIEYIVNGSTYRFCSRRCAAECRRIVDDKKIVWAMERRVAGWLWGRLAANLRCTVQSLQGRIWRRLFFERKLSPTVVQDYWYFCGIGAPPSFQHLIQQTGYKPSHDGGVFVGSARGQARLRARSSGAA